MQRGRKLISTKLRNIWGSDRRYQNRTSYNFSRKKRDQHIKIYLNPVRVNKLHCENIFSQKRSTENATVILNAQFLYSLMIGTKANKISVL